MSPIDKYRQQIDEDAKSRWWRDGLFGLVMGGLMVFVSSEWTGLWYALAGGVVSGLVCMRVGADWMTTGWLYLPIWRRRGSE